MRDANYAFYAWLDKFIPTFFNLKNKELGDIIWVNLMNEFSTQFKEPENVKLFVGIILNQSLNLERVYAELEKTFGTADLKSEVFDFNYTDYYPKEMGERLFRTFVSFENPISPSILCHIKVKTVGMEDKFSSNGKRRVNLDPGYIALSKLVLASTKNFSHRIYMAKGIFAEISLVYRDRRYNPLEWTYPDYREQRVLKYFNKVRDIYKNQLLNSNIEILNKHK